MHYLLFYEKLPDYALRELAHQAAHRAHVFGAVDRGELLLGGPLTDAVDAPTCCCFSPTPQPPLKRLRRPIPTCSTASSRNGERDRGKPWLAPALPAPLPGSESDRRKSVAFLV